MPRPSPSRNASKSLAASADRGNRSAKPRPGNSLRVKPRQRAVSKTQHEPVANVAGLLKRVVYLFRDALDVTLRPFGITAAQLHVLAMLGKQPGLSGAKLARLCTVTPQTMQALIATIEGNGWIRRQHHPENERILLATLTATGEDLLARSRNAMHAIQKRMLRDFPSADVAILESLLEQCALNLDPRATAKVDR
jgi:DNA-binding MarR family transcriptional regulator